MKNRLLGFILPWVSGQQPQISPASNMDMNKFVSWFCEENGTLDTASIDLTDIPGQGRGAVASQDIPEGHNLFTIPRSLTLSTRTSKLYGLVGGATWRSLRLNRGWVGLILCMVWEESHGTGSKWSRYFDILPKTFDTPMFWSEDELKELEGTAVAEKIGKDEAERDYREKLLPALHARPDLFNPAHLSTFYSLENYHLMGSRILSRSFHVEKWEGDMDDDKEVQPQEEIEVQEIDNSMDVDVERESESAVESEKENEDSEGEDEEDTSDVAMVPMADMLNARYGSENAKLFYEPSSLRMVTTKSIKAGEQIYNTYGDPPNSELLRKYGHVDLIRLPDAAPSEGNPADVVEVPADLVVDVVSSSHKGIESDALKERIDWWLEEGGDDVFVIETDLELPEALISFFKLLLLSSLDWDKARSKSKPPKPKLDLDAQIQILPLVFALIEKRLAKYPTTLKHDEDLIIDPASPTLSNNVRNAIIVRLGEKRILTSCAAKLRVLLKEAKAAVWSHDGAEKKDKIGSGALGPKKRKRGKRD